MPVSRARWWPHAAALASRSVIAFLVVFAGGASAPPSVADDSPDGPEWIKRYLTEEEAIAAAYPDADSTRVEEWTLTAEERQGLELGLGWRLPETAFPIHLVWGGGELLGYALVTEEIGLYRPITFLVAADPGGAVTSVQVLVYRESRGGEVRRSRFLRQYRGKTIESPIRIDRDIIPITGATLSVRAINAGVRKVLAVIAARYGSSAAAR